MVLPQLWMCLALAALSHAIPAPSPAPAYIPMQFDLEDFAAIPTSTPVVATGVLSQVISFNPSSAASAAAADVTADLQASTVGLNGRIKRQVNTTFIPSACTGGAAQPTGAGPRVTLDTASAFVSYAGFSAAASDAPVPSGYTKTFTNLQAANNANGYLGFTAIQSYDVQKCADICDAKAGCSSFNIYYERDPSVNPGTGSNCRDPASTTLIKCSFWGGPVTTENALNAGQWRVDFQVVIAGSNGYVSKSVEDAPGYTFPTFLDTSAIISPPDCSNKSTYLGHEVFQGPFHAGRCAAACTAVSNYALAHPPATGRPQLCAFFNTYIVSNNSVPIGQDCAFYSRAYGPEFATNHGQYDPFSNHITISHSYTYSNASDAGACVPEPTPSPPPGGGSAGNASCRRVLGVYIYKLFGVIPLPYAAWFAQYYAGTGHTLAPANPGASRAHPANLYTFPAAEYGTCEALKTCANLAREGVSLRSLDLYGSFELRLRLSSQEWECMQYWNANRDAKWFSVVDADVGEVYGYAVVSGFNN